MAAEFNGGLVFSVKIAAAGDEQTIFHCDIHIVSRGFLIVIRGECFYSVNLPKKDAVQQFCLTEVQVLTGMGQYGDASGVMDQRYRISQGYIADRHVSGLSF